MLAVIEHASRRIRILGATSHPAASWVAQAAKNLIMDLEDADSRARFLIRDRDGKFSGLFDDVLKDAGIEIVLSGVQMPRMNAFMERWVQTCRRELLDRTLIWNQRHLLHALREFEQFYNSHRPHQGIANARPLHALPSPIPEPDVATGLHIHRRDRLGGIFHEYRHAALPARMNFRQAQGRVLVLANRGRPIPALDRDYPDIAVLEVAGLDGHPCVGIDTEWPAHEDGFQVFGSLALSFAHAEASAFPPGPPPVRSVCSMCRISLRCFRGALLTWRARCARTAWSVPILTQ